jgi:tetratricopeptide (TPR) repeat protein
VGKAVKKILFILAGLAGAATLALVFVVFRQETAISMLLVQQAASRERTDSEMQHGLSQLSERVDGISATFSHEIAAGNSGTQGAVRRLQKRLADDISGVRENLADMAVVLNRQAMPPGAAPRAASADVEPVSAEVMEQDLALTQALQRAKSRCGERQFAEAACILTPFSLQHAANPEVRLYLAASRFLANQSDSRVQAAVEQDLRVVLRDQPDSLIALETLGSLCLEQGRWAEALDWLSQVIVFKPADVDVLEKAGTCARAAGDLPQAITFLDKAAALRPADAHLWFEAGRALAAAGKHAEALARFQKCLAIEPHHHGALVGVEKCR